MRRMYCPGWFGEEVRCGEDFRSLDGSKSTGSKWATFCVLDQVFLSFVIDTRDHKLLQRSRRDSRSRRSSRTEVQWVVDDGATATVPESRLDRRQGSTRPFGPRKTRCRCLTGTKYTGSKGNALILGWSHVGRKAGTLEYIMGIRTCFVGTS